MNKNDIMNILKEAVPCVFISAQEPLAELTDYGVVTGYSVIGTGPISEFFASVTDFFGMQSGCFGDKLKYAEECALNMMRLEALKKGADSVYCCDIKVSEATSGKGMLIVSVSGTAILSNIQSKKITDALSALKIFSEESRKKQQDAPTRKFSLWG